MFGLQLKYIFEKKGKIRSERAMGICIPEGLSETYLFIIHNIML